MESNIFKTSPETEIHVNISRPSTRNEHVKSPLLVFLHYWGGSSATWYKLTSPNSGTSLNADYPIMTIDFRGWGQSKGPTGGAATAEDYSVTPLASDIASTLTQLHRDTSHSALIYNGFVIIGHSMGGKVVLATLNCLSADLLGLVKGLVLVAPAPPTPLILPPDMSEQQRGAYNTEESVRWIAQNVLSSAEHLTDDDISIIVRDSLAGSTLAKDGWILHGMREDISPILDSLASRPLAKKVKIQVLAGELDVVEQKDRVEKEVVQSLTKKGFIVSFTVLKGLKHLIPLESPEAISQAISSVLSI
ncbi:putative alpha/beta hydrolase [Talaromyces proteolyticus]|uniref:Alpha/beta hydrolase n=1 Tax=Talaromyces proteolyticus TaxID=1131652 RepID=A0AAD4PVI3_9EURO|nr:putative alpha/beta hydrolase [Talaromyces proteolyticus]KAH8690728.1 putative alpha/beta hydrolase [Talaromyces proteolyticus]